MDKETELRTGLEEARERLVALHEGAEGRSLTEEEQASWDADTKVIEDGDKTLARYDRVRDLSSRGYKEKGAPNLVTRHDPQDALGEIRGASPREARRILTDANMRAMEQHSGHMSTDDQRHFETILKRHAGDTAWASNILARQSDVYQDAWGKMQTGRQLDLTNEERTSLSVGSNTNGGFLLPTHLDPTIIMTNSGVSNVIRGMSRVVTLSAPGATTWNGVTSAGMTASFDAELTEVSDDSPTFARVSIPIGKAQAFAQASIEAFEDIAGLAGDLTMMFADARDRLEAVAHATGSGSGANPTGIFTALDANTNVEITSDTANAIFEDDLHEVYRTVPVRWRGRSEWLMHPLFSLRIKALGTAVSATYSGDLREPPAGRILGRPLTESDDAPSTLTTTALDNVMIFGDFSNYVIVDKPGSMSLEYIPHMFATANNLPDGRRGWYAQWRTGADSVNDLAFRLLQDKTSA